MSELADLDATAQAELIRRREAIPLELVDAAIARIEKVDPQLNAVIIRTFEKARLQARSPELPRGPFGASSARPASSSRAERTRRSRG